MPHQGVVLRIGHASDGCSAQPQHAIEFASGMIGWGDPGPVGVIDHGHDRAHGVGVVGRCRVKRPAGVEGGIAGDERAMAGEIPSSLAHEIVEEPLGCIADHFVAEVSHAMRAVSEDHATDLAGDVDEGHPHGDGAVGVERPIHLILMPWGETPAGLLVQRLIVIQPDTVDVEQLGGDTGEASAENESPREFVVPNDSTSLHERPSVGVALLEWAPIPSASVGAGIDGGLDGRDLCGGGQAANDAMTRATKLLPGCGGNVYTIIEVRLDDDVPHGVIVPRVGGVTLVPGRGVVAIDHVVRAPMGQNVAAPCGRPERRGRSMEFSWTKEQEELRAEARSVAEQAVATYGRANDSWINGWSKEFALELGTRGWIGLTWPVEFGGAGRPPIDRLIIGEELIKAGAPIGSMWFADRQMGPTLMTYGRPDQQAEFLPRILSGASTWCIGMSEPNSGSDLASLKTQAERRGDHWLINGQKIWTSFGAVADYCYLICRTNNEGPPHAGISEIIVPMDTPGIEVRPIKDMTTNRHFCEVFFTDVKVPIENLVGVEGNAFKQTMSQLEHERGGIDRLVSNQALYEIARQKADTSDPVVRQRIAGLEMKYRIGRILVIREVLRQAPAGFSAATKAFCTEHEWDVAQFVASSLGPEAMLWDQVTQGLSYAPGYTIMGGTSNVMRNILGERVLGLPR